MAQQIFNPSLDGYVTRMTDENCGEWVGYSYRDIDSAIYNYVSGNAHGICDPYTSYISRAFMEFNTTNLFPDEAIVKKVVLRVYISNVSSARTRYLYVSSIRPSDYDPSYQAGNIYANSGNGPIVWSGSVTTGWVNYDLGANGITALQNHPTWLALGLLIDETLDGTTGYTYYRSSEYFGNTYTPQLIVYWRRGIIGG
jgi:hypothetical protein